jgi:hypothetical protein
MARPEATKRHRAVDKKADKIARIALLPDGDAYSIDEFCQRYRISVSMFFKMQREGWAPATFKAGARTLISKDSAERWRSDREQIAKRNKRVTA